MEVDKIRSLEVHSPITDQEDTHKWVEEHALRVSRLFKQWQKPLGISGEQYCRYLVEELDDYCDEPLLRSLIESITSPRSVVKVI